MGFESLYDALTLSSAIGERLGIGKITEISEDSTDLLNEFLNVVVGRTISEWDKAGLKVKFGTPTFKKNYEDQGSKHLRGTLIEMNVVQDVVDLKDENYIDKIIFRVNFVQKIENKIENKTILLADDSSVMRRIIGSSLKKQGAVLREAKDGKEAITMHKKYNPNLTIMDINMPNMSGFEAIKEIRKFNPQSRFIILSSSSRMDEIVTAKDLNVSGYLVKPIDEAKLIERVSNLF